MYTMMIYSFFIENDKLYKSTTYKVLDKPQTSELKKLQQNIDIFRRGKVFKLSSILFLKIKASNYMSSKFFQ